MPDTPIEQSIAPGDEQFDPSQLDDAGLQAFLGLTEPRSASAAVADDAPPADAAEGTEAGEAAAAGALETALGEPEPEAEAPVVAPAKAGEKPVADAAVVDEAKDGAGASVAKKPLYVAYGADGKPLAEVPIKEVEITVAGKTKRVDLDKLARMASSGGYNEQLQEEVNSARAIATRAQQLEAQARALAAERDAILRDPDFYLKKVEEFAEAASPEARAQRAEAELQAVRQQQMVQQGETYVAQQAETTILPKIQALLDQHPNVSEQEVVQQFSTLIRPFRGPHGGMIAPQHLPTVLDVIDSAIAPWAAQLHEAREEGKKATEALAAAKTAATEAEAAKKTAQAKSVKARAEVSRTIAPVGRVAAKPAQPKPPAKTANEGADRALDDALDFILNNNAS